MHTILVVFAAAMVAASGSGSQRRSAPVAPSTAQTVGPFTVSGGLLAGATVHEWRALRPLQIVGLTWNESIAGTGTAMRYRLLVDDIEVCVITAACDVSAMVEASCASAASTGSVLRLEVATDSCLIGNPSGSLMVSVR